MLNLKFGNNFFNQKYLILIYSIIVLLFAGYFLHSHTFLDFNFVLLILFILIISGIIILLYSADNELYKTCFIILLIFGIIMSITTPTLIVCDEIEHYARSDITSQGILIPNYIEDRGYNVSGGFEQLLNHRGETITHTSLFNEDMSGDNVIFNGCFPQNPFYPYLLSSIGILLAKLLDLGAIFAVLFGRFFNVIFYSIICAFAIKKAPVHKIPLFVVSCIPLAIYQAASFSSDAFLISMTILAIAYFISMYAKDKVEDKDLIIFFAIILLISLLKLPYILIGFLIFLIKEDKFSSKNIFLISRTVPFVLLVICSAYSLYSSDLLHNTLREQHFIDNAVSPRNQLLNLINHPRHTLNLLLTMGDFVKDMVYDLFRFSYEQWTYESHILGSIYLIYFVLLSVLYNKDIDIFKKRDKCIISAVLLLIFFSIIFIQYLSWAPFNYPRLDMNIGVYIRYYIPFIAFLPIIFGSKRISSKINIKNYDSKIVLSTLIFIAATIIFTLSKFY